MKKAILLSLFSVIFIIAASQSPQGFSYQAVLYNSSGLPVPKAVISVKAGILSDTLTPVIVWEELHSGIKTNASGVFTVVIGTGTKQAGTAAAFPYTPESCGYIYPAQMPVYIDTCKIRTDGD